VKIVVSFERDIITVITNYPLKRGEEMKVHYDKDSDAVYSKFGNQKPDGVIEISEGVNGHTHGQARSTLLPD
jgi:hypothetical protein